MKKRTIILCVALALFAVLPGVAETYSGTCGDNVNWSYNSSTYKLDITGTGTMADYSSISKVPWHSYRESILKVTIGEGVTSIGERVFSSCRGLTSITISNSVTSIGNSAFSYCSGLTSITIPNSVTSIGNYAFEYCSGLTSITISNSVTSIGNSAFSYCSGLTSITIPNSVTSIGNYAFEGCSGLTSITIPNSVTSIGNNAFYDCSGLTSISVDKSNTIYDSRDNCNAIIEKASNTLNVGCSATIIPNSVTSIGNSAFSNCRGLTSITIPNSVTSIGNSAFSNCRGLTSITIPNSVTSIGDYAFSACSSLTSIIIPKSVISLGALEEGKYDDIGGVTVFRYCSNLRVVEVEEGNPVYDSRKNCNAIIETKSNTLLWGCNTSSIPNSVTTIGTSAFYDCSDLTSITIPNSVTSIGDRAFCSCSGLTSITIPNSVTSIGNSAFESCSGLTSITIPSSVTSIGNSAFYSCGGLTSLTIPNSVTSIGDYAFYDCSGLTSVTLPSNVTSIGDWTFHGCSGLTSITIPNSVTSIGRGAFYGCSGLTSITIPNSVTRIGDNVFVKCPSLTSVYVQWEDADEIPAIDKTTFPYSTCDLYVPDGTLSIYQDKEYWNSFRNIPERIPNNEIRYTASSKLSQTTSYSSSGLHTNAFNVSISSHTFADGKGVIKFNGNVTSIGDDAFKECSSLSSVNIPNSVTSIGEWAFYKCSSLTSVNIPNSVTSIGEFAFAQCTKLKLIDIPSSVTSIGERAFSSHSGHVIAHWDKPISISYQGSTAILEFPPSSIALYGTTGWSQFNVNTIQSLASTQTTLTLKIADYSDVINKFDETGVYFNGTYYKAGKDGLIKMEYLRPNSETRVSGYVKYGGVYFVSTNQETFMTKSVIIDVKFRDIKANGVIVSGVYDKGDASHVYKTTFSTSRYGTETEYKNDRFMQTGLNPDQKYTLYYRVYYHYGKNNENSGCEMVERNFTTQKLKMTVLQPRNVSSTSSVVAAETNLSDDETGAGFEWRKYDAPESLPSSKGKAIVYDGRMEGKINNLQPVYYKVRPYYESASGNVYYGDWMTFDPTDFSYFEPTVHTYDFLEGPAANAIEVRGYVMQGTDDVLEQGFEYWKTGGAASPRMMTRGDNEVMRVQATGQMMIATLKDLDYASDYVVRAYVTTAGGTVYGEERTFTTPEDPASGIEQVNSDEDTTSHLFPEGIYTVSGLKIEHISEPGIYICNGKKVLITKDQLSMEW